MSGSCNRKFRMLRMVPRAPCKISTRELREKLSQEGFNYTQRTIQRDLKDLSTDFPDLKSDENKDMAGWFWEAQGELLSIPAIDPPVAFTLKLADTFLSKIMPPAVTDTLEPFRKASNKILGNLDSSNLSEWQDKVQILPRTQQLIPAEIDPAVLRTIYTALLNGHQFSGHYTRRGADKANYNFNPLGIVYRESVIYLVATLWDYEDIRHFALHRFTEVEELDTPCKKIEGFKLTEHIEGGDFDFNINKNKTLKLKVIFAESTGDHLLETPLSEDQKITVKRDGRYQVTATVNDSLQIRWWLLGFGEHVEVIQPKTLRDEFVEISRNFYALYQKE